MKNYFRTPIIVSLLLFNSVSLLSQTSWKGTTSTAFATASNWTNGVPTSSVDAILGDANFSGVYQPTISAISSCKTLTLGGVAATTLTMGKNLNVSGNVTINANGTITQGKSALSLTGNWVNGGTYTANNNNTSVIFNGITQSIGGTFATTFRKLTINTSSTVTLNSNVTISGSGSQFNVNGTISPGESPSYIVTSTGLTAGVASFINVKASTFAGNYSISGATTLSAGSTVDYSAMSLNQAVSNSLTYSTLRISGAGTKTLAGNLPALNSTNASAGKISVITGTLDLSSYTAHRGTTVAGGSILVSNGSFLKIGGTNTYPANYANNTLALTGTVEYSGTNQTVSAQSYGNLTLSSASSAAVKTMPGSAFTVSGNLTSTLGAGTSVSFTAAAAISISGNVVIGTSTTFNGSSYTHNITGNWTNNGTFTGSTSTINIAGPGAVISGTGTHNFYNLIFSASNVTAAGSTNPTIAGDLSTTGSGNFTHSSGGTTTLSGTSKAISGTGIIFDNLSISGSVSNTSSLKITGNLSVSGSISSTAGVVTMSGASKTMSGAGTIAFYGLSLTGSVTTTSAFSIVSSLNVSGTFIASAGTATFTGSSTLNGTANLYNVTLNGTSLLLSTNSILGIANVYTITAGTLDVTSVTPNTVNYNGTGAQSIIAGTYDQLELSNGNTKTAAGALGINGPFTIGSSTTFNASSYTHSVFSNWVNNGTFTAGSSTVQFAGSDDVTISGTNTFNILTVNKSPVNGVNLSNNISVPTLNMTSGWMHTGNNTVTITTTRTGNGIILGNIQRTHGFSTGVAYAFEGPDNSITFSGATGVNSVTVNVATGSIGDFPYGASINRVYDVTIPSGTYTGTLRLHYEDAELNGNAESTLNLWHYNGSAWASSGKTSNSTTSNYVEQSLLSNATNRWTLSFTQSVLAWNGSVSTDWNTPANWSIITGSPASTPGATDIVQIGTSSFSYQPTISTSATVKSILLGSTQITTLTIGSGGSLTVNGNINGSWSTNATHTINAGAQTLIVNGDLTLSDGTAGHAINLNASTGTITIAGSLTESGGANITFSDAVTLNIGSNFNYSSGSFTAGTSTVIYNGLQTQAVAGVTYYHLSINKATGISSINSICNISGDLNVISGELNNYSTTTMIGNVTIGAAAIFHNYLYLHMLGNWTNNGTYIATGASIFFEGSGTQYINANTFNNFNINKPVGSMAILTGNVSLTGNLIVTSGILDLKTFSCNRTTWGGNIILGDLATFIVGGNNPPTNFSAGSLAVNSTVIADGTSPQSIFGENFGHLILRNAGLKTLVSPITVYGNLTIEGGVSFDGGSQTLSLYGNWINNGTFIPSSGALILNGDTKNITGNTVFNKVTVNGSYTVAGYDITYNGRLFITSTGSFAAGIGTATVNGDLTNSGSLTSTGTTTFTGTAVQTIQFINAIVSNSSGVVNFNGTVAPVLNSSSNPNFANVNINNTAGITPSIGWNVYTSMTVNTGAAFYGGPRTHTIYGSFTNNGTVTSAGIINFIPLTAVTLALGSGFSSTGIINFGGAPQITMTGTPSSLNGVTISNTQTAGVSASSGWNMTGDFNISSNALFNAGSYAHTVAGDIDIDGTLNGGTSTFTLSSATGQLTGSPNTTFNHLTLTGFITANSDFNVAGNFTNNGTFDGSVAAVIMTGSNNASIGGTTTPTTLAQLTVSKSSNAVVTMGVNVNSILNLNITAGTLFTSTYTITQDAGGGVLIIRDGATFKLGGNNALPAFSGYVIDTFSTVEFAGGTQSMSTSVNYGNLTISATGIKTPLGNLGVMNNFTLSAGTFAAGNYTHNIGGNWNMTGGTFNNTGNTILLNGAGDQSISSTGAFNNLTINKATGLTSLASDATVNTTLHFTAGKISIGNYNFTIGNSGSISNAGSSNYIIATGTGSLNQQVLVSGTKVFPVGTTTVYTPATIALNSSSVTDIFSARMLTNAYTNGSSGGIITSNAVRATWMIAETVAGGSDATLTVQWPVSLELSGFSRVFSRLAHYTAGVWEYGSGDIAATGSDPYSVSRAGITSFSPFAVSMLQALPVTWLSVTGRHSNGNNIIEWSTASEMNNDVFSIEYATDGIHFREAGQVNGAGTTADVHTYSFIHTRVTEPVYYYRVKQTDINGKYSYSKTIRISITDGLTGPVSLFPNPVVADKVTLSFYIQRGTQLYIKVYDVAGRLMIQKNSFYQKGQQNISLPLTGVPEGMYMISVKDDWGHEEMIKMIRK